MSASNSLFLAGPRVPSNSAGFPHSDTFLIGGQPCPGKATLISGNSPRPWDVRKGYAQSGATVVPAGDDLGKHVFRIELWDPADYPAWLAFANTNFAKAVRFYPKTKVPLPLGIYHPVLSDAPHFVTSVVVTDVTVLVQDDDGKWSCEVHFLEYRKPLPALAKPDAQFGPQQAPLAPAKSKIQAAIVDHAARLDNLANGGK